MSSSGAAGPGFFSRLKAGLARSSEALAEGLVEVFIRRKLDQDSLLQLEDVLIQADLGVETAGVIIDSLSQTRFNKEIEVDEIRQVLAREITNVLVPVEQEFQIGPQCPHVILVIGVNGGGKTTTIGKIAARLCTQGKSVMLVACDTFRAAAIDQLKIWGERISVPVASAGAGSDPASLAYDAINSAREQGTDVLLIDTAGRLQNKSDLMAELEKIIRVLRKIDETAPHQVLLVLDATTGQNALNQVEVFAKIAGVTGLVVTKLDGTAKGGILVAISARHKMPVYFIGVGERVDDLQVFEAQAYARAIAGIE